MSKYLLPTPDKLKKIFQLAYSSIGVPELNSEAIDKIISSAIEYNANRKITGSLIFQDGIFFQILEGDEKDVLALLEKIKKDDRHQELQIAWTATVENRKFDMWSMRYVDYERLDVHEQEYLRKITQKSSALKPNEEVVKILAAAR